MKMSWVPHRSLRRPQLRFRLDFGQAVIDVLGLDAGGHSKGEHKSLRTVREDELRTTTEV